MSFFAGMFDDDGFDEFLRIIGKQGELFAFEDLLDTLVKKDGFTLDETLSTQYEKYLVSPDNSDTLRVVYHNFVENEQTGYDISIDRSNKAQKEYFEVKTTTVTSMYAHSIRLSQEQFCMSCRELEHYNILIERVSCGKLTQKLSKVKFTLLNYPIKAIGEKN